MSALLSDQSQYILITLKTSLSNAWIIKDETPKALVQKKLSRCTKTQIFINKQTHQKRKKKKKPKQKEQRRNYCTVLPKFRMFKMIKYSLTNCQRTMQHAFFWTFQVSYSLLSQACRRTHSIFSCTEMNVQYIHSLAY